VKVRDILERVTTLYHDLDYRRLTQKQYLQFLDDAILAIITYRPDSHEKRVVVQLKPGARQRIPDDGFTLIDVYANMDGINEDGSYVDGKPVFQVSRKDLDYLSNWYHDVQLRNYVDEFAYDIRTPRDFWVNPPVSNLATVRVEIGYSYKHSSFGDLVGVPFSDIQDMPIELSDEFRNALVNYVLYKVFSVDVTADRDISIAQQYLQAFESLLSNSFSSELATTTRILEPTTQGIGLQNTTPVTAQSVKQ
jgi:hypothetical protein